MSTPFPGRLDYFGYFAGNSMIRRHSSCGAPQVCVSPIVCVYARGEQKLMEACVRHISPLPLALSVSCRHLNECIFKLDERKTGTAHRSRPKDEVIPRASFHSKLDKYFFFHSAPESQPVKRDLGNGNRASVRCGAQPANFALLT